MAELEEKTKAKPQTRKCKHCGGEGECKKTKTGKKTHSCEYCLQKSGVKMEAIFPIVPCAYCEGRGFHPSVITINSPKPQNDWKGGAKPWQKKQAEKKK